MKLEKTFPAAGGLTGYIIPPCSPTKRPACKCAGCRSRSSKRMLRHGESTYVEENESNRY
ncbi:hypothetical protein B0G77_2174 [Paraburkholderia sp. BL10I2N1]|nr:hypothetical protein B0G77_2174 [Paraburkholderia sp. BL10I2N1]